MKIFEARQIREAQEHAAAGGQALHLHQFLTPGAPRCFKAAVGRGEDIAHLFDQNLGRLKDTARELGVNVVVVDREGQVGQHIDLCGKPLRKALEMCQGGLF